MTGAGGFSRRYRDLALPRASRQPVSVDASAGAAVRHATAPPLEVGKRHVVFTFVAAVALVCYPALASPWADGVGTAFRYLADDAFYYLAIADHSADAPHFTFDGTHPTNGFHPLWQYALTLGFRLPGLEGEAQIWFVFATSLALVAAGTGLFAIAVLHSIRNVSLALLAAVPGLYWWLVPSANPGLGSQWTFVNGMESPVSIFLFGVLAWLLVNRGMLNGPASPRTTACIAFLLSLLTLSRLDDVFLFVPFGVWLALRAPSRRVLIRSGAAGIAVPAALVGGYLLFNVYYAGIALPSSGTEKAGGLVDGLLRNGYGVLTSLFPGADVRDVAPGVWADETWHIAQMLVPAAAALFWLMTAGPRLSRTFADETAYHHALLCTFSAYVLIKTGYNFCFVGLWHQGHWYYPLNLMIFNWLLATIAAGVVDAGGVHRFLRPLRLGRWSVSLPSLAPVFCVLWILLGANVFANVKAQRPAPSSFAFWSQRDAIGDAVVARCPGCGILSFDDGIVGYALPVPTMNGIGLTLDRNALAAKRRGELLALAHRRGHRLLVSVSYPIASDLSAANLRERLAGYRHLRSEDLEGWNFEIVFRDPASGATFVRFEPRPPTQGGVL